MKKIRHSLPRQALISALLLTLSPLSWSAQSVPTTTVQGRAPVAAPIITGTAGVGNTLTALAGFTDADGDSESGTLYAWNGGGVFVYTPTLVVPPSAGGNTLTLYVIPKTDAAVTEPAEGVEQTATIAIPASLGRFLTPDKIARTWPDADDYCRGLGGGARLPTRFELTDLFLSATSAGTVHLNNSELCTIHKWPLAGQCGGSTSSYWAIEQGGSDHFYVQLDYGFIYKILDSVKLHVACVR
ncbi:hypothetical protein [Pseudomonas peli]|uniref:hypothetical protein n=1 Tax=Pseudomonas peli TaxID=592361 RepID=UPI0024ADB69B|nr:hypothetical protein [Pseudomonas peli]